MAVQIANAYGFNVKRISLMPAPVVPSSGAGGGSSGFWPAGPWSTAGGIAQPFAEYQGEQVFVLAANEPAAYAVLQAQYGADLGPVTGGTTHVYGALTTMTGS